MTKVAIVTVNYNGKKDTLELLRSFKKLPTAPSGTCYQLLTIVVDNGSTDGCVDNIKAQYPSVDILQNGENKGFAGGYNRGINYALIWGADYILIINNDCLIKDEDVLNELIKTAQSDDGIGLVSPKIYFAKGYEFHKNRYAPSELGHVIWYAGGKFDWNNIGSEHFGIDQVDKGQFGGVGETELVSGACMLIKREALERVGLFDERFFLYFEDNDFSKRVEDAGFKKFYNGKTSIYHKVSQSTGIGSVVTDYYHTRNRLIVGMKYGKFRTKLALVRETIKLLIFGRSAQRQGVLDYYLGVKGEGSLNLQTRSADLELEYPLKLSICIVNYNTADLARNLLQSIFSKVSGFDEREMEVIVLDNGSADNCKQVIKDFGPKIKYLQNLENEGFSKGYNKTISYSKGRYILLLNSDIEVLEGSLTELIKWAQEFKDSAVLGGKLVFPDKTDQDSVFHLPTLTGAFNEYFLAKKGSYFMYEPQGERLSKVEGLVMACFLIPQSIIYKVGLLDEGTFIFFEDIEYARRLKQAGIPLYFVPSAKFIHHHGGATKRIGEEEAIKLLKQGAIHYHGLVYYTFLSFILWLGQKLGRVKTPVSRWTVAKD